MRSIVDPASDWYPASFPVIIYILYYNIGPRYKATRLYAKTNHISYRHFLFSFFCVSVVIYPWIQDYTNLSLWRSSEPYKLDPQNDNHYKGEIPATKYTDTSKCNDSSGIQLYYVSNQTSMLGIIIQGRLVLWTKIMCRLHFWLR